MGASLVRDLEVVLQSPCQERFQVGKMRAICLWVEIPPNSGSNSGRGWRPPLAGAAPLALGAGRWAVVRAAGAFGARLAGAVSAIRAAAGGRDRGRRRAH
jgi:hypothetical protein